MLRFAQVAVLITSNFSLAYAQSDTASVSMQVECPVPTLDTVTQATTKTLSVLVLDVGQECPEEAFGAAHTQACESCASQHLDPESKFVFCVGCARDQHLYATCDDVVNFANENEGEGDTAQATTADPTRRLASDNLLASKSTKPSSGSISASDSLRRAQTYSASCNMQDTNQAPFYGPEIVAIDCELCASAPILLSQCCHACYGLATSDDLEANMFVKCLHCEDARAFDGVNDVVTPDAPLAKNFATRDADINAYVESEISNMVSGSSAGNICAHATGVRNGQRSSSGAVMSPTLKISFSMMILAALTY